MRSFPAILLLLALALLAIAQPTHAGIITATARVPMLEPPVRPSWSLYATGGRFAIVRGPLLSGLSDFIYTEITRANAINAGADFDKWEDILNNPGPVLFSTMNWKFPVAVDAPLVHDGMPIKLGKIRMEIHNYVWPPAPGAPAPTVIAYAIPVPEPTTLLPLLLLAKWRTRRRTIQRPW